MSTPTSPERRASIVAGLRAGHSQGQVARDNGCHRSTVCRIAQAEGIDSNIAATQKAIAARHDYDQAQRLALLNQFFDKALELLGQCSKPHDLQSLATALAILVDKRRLEDGEATSRQEINQSGARDQALARITDLAQRRRAS